MVALLSSAADAQSVRIAISTLLDTDDLPDAVILDDVYAGRASDRVRHWLTRWGVNPVPQDNDPSMRRAAVLATASFVVQAQPHLLSERLPDSTFTYQARPQDEGPADRAAALMQQAAMALAEGLNLDTRQLFQPRTFSKAVGRRGQLGGGRAVFGPAPGVALDAPWYAGDTPNPG